MFKHTYKNFENYSKILNIAERTKFSACLKITCNEQYFSRICVEVKKKNNKISEEKSSKSANCNEDNFTN